MAFDNYQTKRYTNKSNELVNDNLTIEKPLQVKLNSSVITLTMRTPGSDIELIAGLLYTEDIYKKPLLKNEVTFTEEVNITVANINLDTYLTKKGYLNSRNFLSVSSCGICGKKELQEFQPTEIPNHQISIDELNLFFKTMNKNQQTFIQSGGSHAAAAFNSNGDLLSIQEDIGRHNAVDKVIGSLILQQKLDSAICIIVSGRISYELVIKAFSAKIPILAAVSAPSSLAVDFAKEFGITLLGFCRDGKASCYSHPERIKS